LVDEHRALAQGPQAQASEPAADQLAAALRSPDAAQGVLSQRVEPEEAPAGRAAEKYKGRRLAVAFDEASEP